MALENLSLASLSPQEIVDPQPLTIAPDASLMDAIALMSQARNHCSLTEMEQLTGVGMAQKARASCVIGVETGQPVGVLTERDCVRFAAQGMNFEAVTVADVMTQSLVALKQKDFRDIFVALNLFRQHQIRHLPIIDEDGQLAGLVTTSRLRASLQATDLLKIRRVGEVMTTDVIQAPPSISILKLTQLMAEHKVSCVVVVEEQVELPCESKNAADRSACRPVVPVGMLTERDIVQFQVLGLDLHRTCAQTVMSTPLSCLKPQDSLWTAHQEMQRQNVGKILVSSEQQELLGIVTQTNILRSINPAEMYEVIRSLQRTVEQLQAEKTEKKQLIAPLQRQTESDRIVATIAQRIRQTLHLEDILNTTVEDVRQFLQVDRAIVYRFAPDWSGVVVAESVAPGWDSLLGREIKDPCFNSTWITPYCNGHTRSIADIHTADLSLCHFELLEQLQMRAKLLVPIVQHTSNTQSPHSATSDNPQTRLWGLLIANQCEEPRQWQSWETDLLKKLAVQVAIAIQQSELYQQAQAELIERRQAQAALTTSETKYRSLVEHLADGLYLLDADFQLVYLNPAMATIFRRPTSYLSVNYPDCIRSCVHREDWQQVAKAFSDLALGKEQLEVQYRILAPSGTLHYLRERLQIIRDRHGNVQNYQGIVSDLTAAKSTEVALQKSIHEYYTLTSISPVGIFRTDKWGNCWYVNERWQQVAGLTGKATLGTGWLRAIHADDRAWVIPEWEQALQANQSFQAEFRFQKPDGTTTWVFGQVVPELDEANDLVGYVGTITNISDLYQALRDRERAEAALRSQVEFDRLVANISTRFINLDLEEIDNGIELALEAIGNLTQVDTSYVILFADNDTMSMTHEWVAAGIEPNFKHFQDVPLTAFPWATGQIQRDEIVHVPSVTKLAPDFAIDRAGWEALKIQSVIAIPLSCQGQAIGGVGFASYHREKTWSENNINLLRIVGEIFTNTLQRQRSDLALRHTETSLRESEKRYAILADASPVGIFRTNIQGTCLYVNQTWCEITGVSFTETVGSAWSSGIHSEDREWAVADWSRSLQNRELFRLEYRIQRADGSIRWVLGQAVPEVDALNNLVGYMGTITDISNRKRIEEALCYRNTFERLIASISSHFVNIDFGEIDAGISWALNRIGEFVKIDRSYVFRFSKDKTTVSNTNEWCAKDIEPKIGQMQDICLDVALPWFATKIKRCEIIHVAEIAELPALAQVEKAHFESLSIQSLLVVPMVLSNALIGFVGFDSVRVAKNWEDDEIALLRLMGETFANALKRKETEEELQKLNQALESKVEQRTAELRQSNRNLLAEVLERKQAQEALLKSSATNRALLEAIPDAIFRIGQSGTLVNYKAAQDNSALIPLKQVNGKKVETVLPEPIAQKMLDAIARALETKKLQSFEYELSNNDSSTYWETRLAVSDDEEVMAIVRDISDRKQAEVDLRQALEKEQELNQLKSRFVSMTSHEFRTPLTTILGSAELLQHYGASWSEEKKETFLVRIADTVQHMTKMLDDILILGKAESGQLTLNPITINPVQFCNLLVEELQTGAGKDREIVFNHSGDFTNLEGALPLLDEKLLRHILVNLLSNAIKYSPDDSTVTFNLKCQPERVKFQIQDRGIGIPEADRQRLFESFHRCSNVGNISGTGLGMAIVKRSVDLCGGTIAVDSKIGQGTTFTVLLPFLTSAQPLQPIQQGDPLCSKLEPSGGTSNLVLQN